MQYIIGNFCKYIANSDIWNLHNPYISLIIFAAWIIKAYLLQNDDGLESNHLWS